MQDSDVAISDRVEAQDRWDISRTGANPNPACSFLCACVCVRVSVRVCTRTYVRARERVCVHVCACVCVCLGHQGSHQKPPGSPCTLIPTTLSCASDPCATVRCGWGCPCEVIGGTASCRDPDTGEPCPCPDYECPTGCHCWAANEGPGATCVLDGTDLEPCPCQLECPGGCHCSWVNGNAVCVDDTTGVDTNQCNPCRSARCGYGCPCRYVVLCFHEK